MSRKPFFLALAAVLATLLTSSGVRAWGGVHGTAASVSSSAKASPAHWDPYSGHWVGGRYGYGPDPASDRGPYFGETYGSNNYTYYGSYAAPSIYAAGLRTGTWGP